MNACAELPTEEWRQSQSSAFYRMHERLVTWGLIMLKGAGAVSDEEEPQARYREWSGHQQEEAMNLHRRVIRLPNPEHRIVLQAFYALNVAGRWYAEDIVPVWLKIERELSPEVNERLRNVARDTFTQPVTIEPWQFRGVRERATHILKNSEPVT